MRERVSKETAAKIQLNYWSRFLVAASKGSDGYQSQDRILKHLLVSQRLVLLGVASRLSAMIGKRVRMGEGGGWEGVGRDRVRALKNCDLLLSIFGEYSLLQSVCRVLCMRVLLTRV